MPQSTREKSSLIWYESHIFDFVQQSAGPPPQKKKYDNFLEVFFTVLGLAFYFLAGSYNTYRVRGLDEKGGRPWLEEVVNKLWPAVKPMFENWICPKSEPVIIQILDNPDDEIQMLS